MLYAAPRVFRRPCYTLLAGLGILIALTCPQTGSASEIHTAVIKRDMAKVRELAAMAEGIFNTPDVGNKKKTPLMYAVAANDVAMVEFMLAQTSTDPEVTDENGTSPLKLALELKFRPILSLLLDHGVNLDTVYPNRQTPDELCLSAGPEITELFIKHKKGILQDRSRTFRFLRTALKMNHPEVLDIMLKIDPPLASAETADVRKDTLFHLVAGYGTAQQLKAMINAGADPRKPNGLGLTPYQIAFTETLNGETADCLWPYEKNVVLKELKDAKDPGGLADYLKRALTAGAVMVARDAIVAGAKFNPKSLGSDCPLIQALSSNRPAMIDFVSSKGVGVNSVVTADGDTALIWALQNGRFSSAKLLLEKGANPSAKTKKGVSALMCMLPQLLEVVDEVEKGRNTSPSAVNDCLAMTQVLLESGGWMQLTSVQKETFVLCAISLVPDDRNHSNFAAADALLALLSKQPGVTNMNFANDIERGTSPAEYALTRNKQMALANLIAHKVNMKMPKSKMAAPILQAIEWYSSGQRNRDFLELLLNADIDPSAKGYLGDTALHLAVRKRYLWMIPMLLEKAADPNVQNMAHKSPMDEFKVLLIHALEKNSVSPTDDEHIPKPQEWADALQAMLKHGAKLSITKSTGNQRSYDEMIRALPNPEIQAVLNPETAKQPEGPRP